MNLIVWLVIGGVVGWLASIIMKRDAQQGKPEVALEGLTPDQRFFLGWGQAWREKARDASLRNQLLTNVHAPGPYRSETVRNLDAWYTAFDVKEGQARYLSPEKRVKVW